MEAEGRKWHERRDTGKIDEMWCGLKACKNSSNRKKSLAEQMKGLEFGTVNDSPSRENRILCVLAVNLDALESYL